MIDLQEYMDFFDKMNIKFIVRNCYPKNKPSVTVLSICDEHISSEIYSGSVDIRFDLETGKFICFEPYGE